MLYYLRKIAMRAGDDERMINYEWPVRYVCIYFAVEKFEITLKSKSYNRK